MHYSGGYQDAFLCKLSISGALIWANSWGSTRGDSVSSMVIDPKGYSYVTGYYGDTVDFRPGIGVDNHTAYGEWDAFLMKTNPIGTW